MTHGREFLEIWIAAAVPVIAWLLLRRRVPGKTWIYVGIYWVAVGLIVSHIWWMSAPLICAGIGLAVWDYRRPRATKDA